MESDVIHISLKSRYYPKVLKHISDPPKILYARGNVELLNTPCLVVVGTRKITEYGKQVVKHIVPELTRHFTIVSGLALGIDAAAHEATLDAGGMTIAVLGSGIDDITPHTNYKLGKRILDSGGLIISEYPPKFQARPGTFPVRNRIVSGISKGVLIVEADLKSGSLITGRLAAEQGRDVFAVPGSIFSKRTEGPFHLIKSGAKMVTCAEDILVEYDQLGLEKPRHRNLSLSPLETTLLDILDQSGTMNVDAMIETSKSKPAEVIAALSILELKGAIREVGTGRYQKA